MCRLNSFIFQVYVSLRLFEKPQNLLFEYSFIQLEASTDSLTTKRGREIDSEWEHQYDELAHLFNPIDSIFRWKIFKWRTELAKQNWNIKELEKLVDFSLLNT